MFVDILRLYLQVKVRLGAILSSIIMSSAILDDILRHLFIYQSLKLGLFTPRDLLG